MMDNMNIWREASVSEVKSIQLKILTTVRDFCEKNNIQFFLMYGTLLGAVRHKGYIPWDDDVDICMLKDDYKKFVRLFNCKQSQYQVYDREIDKTFPYYFAKIADTNTKLCEFIDGKLIDLGINIDLFLLDTIPNDSKQRLKMFKKVYNIRRKMIFTTIDKTQKRVWYKEMILRVSEFFPWKQTADYCWDVQRVVEKYRDANSDSVFEMMSPYGLKSILPLKYFTSTCELDFEGEMFPVPAEYDLVLRALYGDYLTLPPKDKQITHHSYRAYLKDSVKK